MEPTRQEKQRKTHTHLKRSTKREIKAEGDWKKQDGGLLSMEHKDLNNTHLHQRSTWWKEGRTGSEASSAQHNTIVQQHLIVRVDLPPQQPAHFFLSAIPDGKYKYAQCNFTLKCHSFTHLRCSTKNPQYQGYNYLKCIECNLHYQMSLWLS